MGEELKDPIAFTPFKPSPLFFSEYFGKHHCTQMQLVLFGLDGEKTMLERFLVKELHSSHMTWLLF